MYNYGDFPFFFTLERQRRLSSRLIYQLLVDVEVKIICSNKGLILLLRQKCCHLGCHYTARGYWKRTMKLSYPVKFDAFSDGNSENGAGRF